jgi:glycerol uptake facilitator-like aquaporin
VGTFALVLFGCGAITVEPAEVGSAGSAFRSPSASSSPRWSSRSPMSRARTDAQSFAWEVVMTATLLLVILAVAGEASFRVSGAAIAIGGTIALASLVGGLISGASLNPARSLGPAVVAGDLGSLWIYLVAPLLGGALGALLHERVKLMVPLDQPYATPQNPLHRPGKGSTRGAPCCC